MKIRKAAVCLFFAALLLIGALASGDYGVPTDEPSEQIILQENMHEYAVRLLGEESSAAQWYRQRGINRISLSIEKDHGQCAYYLFMPVFAALEDQPQAMTTAWHLWTWLWFMAGVVAIYGFCRETGLTTPQSLMGSLLLYLCPRFFAEGHYNNKDMVLLSLVLFTLWMGARFLKQPGFLRGALLSLFGAMAANTKIVGAFPWAVMGLCAVVLVTSQRRWTLRMTLTALETVAVFAVCYALLTPACWSGVGDYVRYLMENASGFTRWTGVVLFRDMIIDQTVQPLPRYYLIWLMIITLPLYVIPLAAAGQINVLCRLGKSRLKSLGDPVLLSLLAASLCWFAPLFAAALIRPLVYNGWRHFYFTYAGVALLAAHGIGAMMRLLRRVCRDFGMHRLFALGLCLCFAWMAWGIAENHPNQYAYYNRLGRENAESEMELDYWNVSIAEAMETLTVCQRNQSLPLVLGQRDSMTYLGMERNRPALSQQTLDLIDIQENPDAPYLISNTTYARIYGVEPPQGYRTLFTIRSYGLPVCAVYEKE